MYSSLKKLILSGTGKDTLVVSFGTLLNVTTGAVFFIFVARILGPSDYGLFSTVVATGVMAASLANFGIDTGILKFAKYPSSSFEKILSLAFKSYLISGFLFALIGLSAAQLVANYLEQPQIVNLLRIAFVGNILTLFSNFYVASLQVKKEFVKASAVNISSNIVRILLFAIAAYFFTIGLYQLTTIFFVVNIVSVVVGRSMLAFKNHKSTKTEIIQFHKYNFWIAVSLILSSIPFDSYLVLKLAGPVQTGLYAAPFKILSFAHQFGGNFTRVLASRFSSFDNVQKAKVYALKSMIPVSFFIAGMLVAIILSAPIINVLFGDGFEDSIAVFRILSIGFIIFFASCVPSAIILYFLGKSQVAFIITFFKYSIFVLLLLVLIPNLKARGAALAFTLSEFSAYVFMLLYSINKLSNMQASQKR